MPTCRKCGARFPTMVELGGKIRNFQRRKYCLSCSPFGSHNTRSLHGRTEKESTTGPEVVCRRCSRTYTYNRAKGHTRTLCNSCTANQQRTKRKAKAVEYKGGRCSCGYNKCLRALGFHHRNRSLKELSISQMMSMSWERLRKELDKCELICANCHMEEEDKLIRAGVAQPGSSNRSITDRSQVQILPPAPV